MHVQLLRPTSAMGGVALMKWTIRARPPASTCARALACTHFLGAARAGAHFEMAAAKLIADPAHAAAEEPWMKDPVKSASTQVRHSSSPHTAQCERMRVRPHARTH